MEITEKLAQFVVETDFQGMPKEAVRNTKNAMLDTLGVTLAGSLQPAGRIINSFVKKLGGKPRAGVVGGKFRTSAPLAALANGTLGHALDYDDTDARSQGHPSVPLLPTVLALGEELGVSGKKIIAAYIVGVEVWSRTASVMPNLHLRGWHPTSVFGTLGAAAAAANLMKLSRAQTKMALGLAGSQAAGLGQNFGTMTKPFHAGNAAKSGVTAAMLAGDGFTATEDILEGHLGFPLAFYSRGDLDLSKITENLGNPWAVASPGINVKKYPTCYGTHRTLDGILHLAEKYAFSADEVEAVDCWVSPRIFKILFYTDPTTELEGKFSMQFCMAMALLEGRVGLKQVTYEKVNDPKIKALMRRVTLHAYADWVEGMSSEERADVVKVRLKNGQEYSHEVLKARGHADVPLSREELLAKYRECAGLVLEERDVERSIELLENLEELGSIGELMNIVTTK